MENGNVISVRPDEGTLVTLHDMPTRPMAKVGRSATAEATSRREFFDMFVWKECKSCKRYNEVEVRPKSHRYLYRF